MIEKSEKLADMVYDKNKFEDIKKINPTANRRSGIVIMLSLIGMVKPMAHIMLMCITFGVLGFLAATAITVLGAEMILTTMGESVLGLSIAALSVILLLCAVLRGILRYAEQACGHYIAFKLLATIRDKVFSALRRLAPAKLDGKGRGDLITLITGDIELLEVFYAHTIAPVCIGFTMSLIMSILISLFNPVLGICAAISYLMIGFILPISLSKMSSTQGMEVRNKLGDLNSFFLESLRGINESLQFGTDEKRAAEIEEKTKEINALQHKVKEHEGMGFALSALSVSVLTLVMLGVNMFLGTDFSTTLITTVMLSASFGPVLALSNLSATLSATLASGERILSLLEEEPETEDITDGKTPEFKGAKIESLNFAYKEEQILQDVTMDFEKGELIAVIGKSGSGKSTLLKLLMRFWNAKQGKIEISNVSVNDINTSHLRKIESFMTQDTDLFQGTIRENILIAKSDASEEEIKEAAKKASIHDFIMTLHDGYDTKVAELGESLSGGERQRIGLARAFLHDSDFMLLDEPTSNLDSLNEGMILKSLRDYKGDKTIILVSHRASTVKLADKTYALKSGRMS